MITRAVLILKTEFSFLKIVHANTRYVCRLFISELKILGNENNLYTRISDWQE